MTVADPMALWTGAVTLAGDVTLNVPAGTTFVCPPVKGAGTLTKTGAGVATFPTVADTVTLVVAEAGGQTSPVKDGVLSLHGGEIALDGTVESCEYYGLYIKYYIHVGTQSLKVIEKNDGVNIYDPGQRVKVILNPNDIMAYAPSAEEVE